MGSMPEYDVASLEENAERIDASIEDIKGKIREEVAAKSKHDETILAFELGIKNLDDTRKSLRRMAEQIRQAEVERVASGDTDVRQAGEPDAAGNGGSA